MTTNASAPSDRPAGPSRGGAAPAWIPISRGELLWLTGSLWVGGTAILVLLPAILVTRLGIGDFAAVVASYAVFFGAWQPVQTITQRALGTRAAVVRMLMFVVTAFAAGFTLKAVLFGP